MRRVICTCDRCGKNIDGESRMICGEVVDPQVDVLIEIDHWEDRIDLCEDCYNDIKREVNQLVFDPKGIKSAAAKIMEKEPVPYEKVNGGMTKAERIKWIMDLVKEGHSYEYIAKEIGVSKATVGAVVKKMREENNDAD